MDVVADLDAALTRLLRRQLNDDGLAIEGLHQLSGGASRETWSFLVQRSDGTRTALILRRDPPTLSRPEGMSNEAAAIVAAARAGVPEPRLLAHSDDPAVLGSPFMVMEHIDGETIARRILRDDQFASVRPKLASQCGEILARIHAIPLEQMAGLEEWDPVARTREQFEQLSADFGDAHPALELGFQWLEANRPAGGAVAVVHGDFRHGNLIIGPDGIRAVLDWEVVHRGDPMEDLGWLCVKAWRFGAAPPVGGFGDYEELFESYERVSGTTLDPAVVRWWQVLGTLRWGVGCMGQASRYTSGAVRSVELAALGRRVCEQEHDLLLLLDEVSRPG